MEDDSDRWLRDNINADFALLHRTGEVLYEGRTNYQFAQVVRSRRLGVCLVLDGKVQSSEADEFIYHEALVHPAMLAHPAPATVFIAGGGEGATLRETLAHQTVRKAVMVDIDEAVVALSRRFLPHLARGAFEDKRAELYHVDAREYLEKSKDRFDVIIIDLPDPIEEGPAYRLYTSEFYRMARGRLTEGGLLAVQAGSALLTELLNFTAVYHTLKSVFKIVAPYAVDMPCFGSPWGFCVASDGSDPAAASPAEVDRRIAARGLSGLRLYDGLAHRGMFSIPKYLREALAGQQRLITDAAPLFLKNN
jgi:spermidine synthase